MFWLVLEHFSWWSPLKLVVFMADMWLLKTTPLSHGAEVGASLQSPALKSVWDHCPVGTPHVTKLQTSTCWSEFRSSILYFLKLFHVLCAVHQNHSLILPPPCFTVGTLKGHLSFGHPCHCGQKAFSLSCLSRSSLAQPLSLKVWSWEQVFVSPLSLWHKTGFTVDRDTGVQWVVGSQQVVAMVDLGLFLDIPTNFFSSDGCTWILISPLSAAGKDKQLQSLMVTSETLTGPVSIKWRHLEHSAPLLNRFRWTYVQNIFQPVCIVLTLCGLQKITLNSIFFLQFLFWQIIIYMLPGNKWIHLKNSAQMTFIMFMKSGWKPLSKHSCLRSVWKWAL